MGYQWVATELLTGVQICDLNDLVAVSPVTDTIGRYEIVNVQLPLPKAPPEWERATKPEATAYWLLKDNPAGGQPLILWAGYVTQRERQDGDVLPLTLSTFPGYFDQRFTGARSYTNQGQNDIVADLINNVIATGPDGGLPITVQYVTPGVGQLRTQTYADQDDKTVYSALQDAMNWQGGPEWWVGGVWDGQLIKPVLYVGDRLGTAVPVMSNPQAVFDIPGCCEAVSYVESFASGKGANTVMAYSSGQGTTRPQSPAQTVADPDRPTVEYRWTPSTSILDISTLTSDAQQALTRMQNGSRSLTMTAVADQDGTPEYMVDWVLGDDVGFAIGTPYLYRDTFNDTFTDSFATVNTAGSVPAFPGGFTGNARVIGHQLTLGNTRTIIPVLAGGDLDLVN